jgi:hypothetical protein
MEKVHINNAPRVLSQSATQFLRGYWHEALQLPMATEVDVPAYT